LWVFFCHRHHTGFLLLPINLPAIGILIYHFFKTNLFFFLPLCSSGCSFQKSPCVEAGVLVPQSLLASMPSVHPRFLGFIFFFFLIYNFFPEVYELSLSKLNTAKLSIYGNCNNMEPSG